ncbi:alpha/beta-hydrolase [Aureobasidium subglaciale]|nr:alpha/beta-hydrolase [Aureobasidium subglaciale]
MSNSQDIIIPRPGDANTKPQTPILGPTEEEFTSTFGSLLPPAQYLETANGKVAYYIYSPTKPSSPTDQTKPTTPTTPTSRILFLHGVQTPSLGLQPLAKSLHCLFPTSEFILLDLYGHGLSSTPLVPHTPSLFHDLIDNLLTHLSWPCCHILGYSFGGATATSYIASSAARAKKVQSLTLIAPAGLWKPIPFSPKKFSSPEYTEARTYILQLLEGGPLIIPNDWEARMQKGQIVAEKIREWQMHHHPGHTASVIAIVRDGGIMGQEDVFAKAVDSNVPILAVLGESDDVVLEADLKAVGVEDVVIVKGAGHAVVREKVGEVCAAVRGFWEKLEV